MQHNDSLAVIARSPLIHVPGWQEHDVVVVKFIVRKDVRVGRRQGLGVKESGQASGETTTYTNKHRGVKWQVQETDHSACYLPLQVHVLVPERQMS